MNRHHLRVTDFKTQYGLGYNPQDDEIVVDFFFFFFCGGGGGDGGAGLEMGLGRTVSVAKNHSPQAIPGPGTEAYRRGAGRGSTRNRQQLLRPA